MIQLGINNVCFSAEQCFHIHNTKQILRFHALLTEQTNTCKNPTSSFIMSTAAVSAGDSSGAGGSGGGDRKKNMGKPEALKLREAAGYPGSRVCDRCHE